MQIIALSSRVLKPSIALAVGAFVIVSADGAAQDVPPVPRCGFRPELQPCTSPLDTPVRLIYEPPLALSGVERRAPRFWLYVDASGLVQKLQLYRPVGMDWDLPAAERARQLRFEPARRDGEAVATWVFMEVEIVPPQGTCEDYPDAVPVSAGVAMLQDSFVLEPPELGTQYRYESLAGFTIDVFVYSGDGWPEASVQVKDAVAALRAGAVEGGPDSLRVRDERRRRVNVEWGSRSNAIEGYEATLEVWFGETRGQSHLAVFRSGDYWKIRATHNGSNTARAIVREFTAQILEHADWRTAGCPLR